MSRLSAFISSYLDYDVVSSYKVGLREDWQLCRMTLDEIGTNVITRIIQYVQVLPFRRQGFQSSLFQMSYNLIGAAHRD
jgi:hypothetical protein